MVVIGEVPTAVVVIGEVPTAVVVIGDAAPGDAAAGEALPARRSAAVASSARTLAASASARAACASARAAFATASAAVARSSRRRRCTLSRAVADTGGSGAAALPGSPSVCVAASKADVARAAAASVAVGDAIMCCLCASFCGSAPSSPCATCCSALPAKSRSAFSSVCQLTDRWCSNSTSTERLLTVCRALAIEASGYETYCLSSASCSCSSLRCCNAAADGLGGGCAARRQKMEIGELSSSSACAANWGAATCGVVFRTSSGIGRVGLPRIGRVREHVS